MEFGNKILEFAESHPYILLAIVILLIIAIIYMYINSRAKTEKATARRKKKKPIDEDDLDELVDTIHDKQKRKHTDT